MTEREEHDIGILGPTWIADQIARAEARDAEEIGQNDEQEKRVGPARALGIWIILSALLWGGIIAALLIAFDPLNIIR